MGAFEISEIVDECPHITLQKIIKSVFIQLKMNTLNKSGLKTSIKSQLHSKLKSKSKDALDDELNSLIDRKRKKI